MLADPVFTAADPRVRRVLTATRPAAVAPAAPPSHEDNGWPDLGKLPRLIGSRREASAILALVPASDRRAAFDFEASRQTATAPALADYRIIHFATHSLLNSRHPELSGIVLSLVDADGRTSDGFLRLHELFNLRLPADLVVLSACQTALGRDVRGKGWSA